jgi:hypothetical protein
MKAYWVFGAAAAEPNAQTGECSVTVRANVRHDMPERMLLHAELRSPAMFREIDVEVHWRMGSVQANAANNACCAPVVVQLENVRGCSASSEALGHATSLAQPGTRINVFLDRLVAYRDENLETAILAHVLAHEITHVLRSENRRSANGMVKAHWDIADYQCAKSHSLPFAPEDVESIRRGIAKRMLKSAAA